MFPSDDSGIASPVLQLPSPGRFSAFPIAVDARTAFETGLLMTEHVQLATRLMFLFGADSSWSLAVVCEALMTF